MINAINYDWIQSIMIIAKAAEAFSLCRNVRMMDRRQQATDKRQLDS